MYVYIYIYRLLYKIAAVTYMDLLACHSIYKLILRIIGNKMLTFLYMKAVCVHFRANYVIYYCIGILFAKYLKMERLTSPLRSTEANVSLIANMFAEVTILHISAPV